MKSIFVLYMPGHAGNFLTRLFSLSPETFPHLSINDLTNSFLSKTLKSINRIEYYSFGRAETHHISWQEFHREYFDFHQADEVTTINNVLPTQFPNVIYSIHPHEFIKYKTKILTTELDCYHVELDLDKFGEWVKEARYNLNFVTRPGEAKGFTEVVNELNSKAISLTKMLISEKDFLEEYNRVCALMKITPNNEQALTLYREWYNIRVNPTNKSLQLDITVLSRAPNDEFTFSLFKSLVETVNHDYEAYYVWTNPPRDFSKFLESFRPWRANVIIGIKDLLDMWVDFNWWQDSSQFGSKLISKMVNKYPDTNFILLTSLENLDKEFKGISNIQIVPWGGDFINQASSYPDIPPVLGKNFNSTKPFICLNRQARDHRVVLLSYLFGKGYNKYGDISFLLQNKWLKEDLLDLLPWEFNMEQHADARDAILEGYKKVYNNRSLIVDNVDIYGSSVNNNYVNFMNKLQSRYKNSFVEIITESSFAPPSYMITEKFLNSVYGCNFPILLGGEGAVAHLRNVGFDMFDDIIDHSYDTMSNPFDRIIAAVDLNSQLLTDAEYVKDLWKTNQSRFEHNVEFAKNHMYSWYRDRTITEFSKIKWK